jgi:diguanylate cyclase (GGDEF)-like protein
MPNKLLHRLEAMTNHRDTILLEQGVITTLRDLLDVQDIRLYDIARRGDDLFIALSTWCDQEELHSRHASLTEKDYEPISFYPEIMASITRSSDSGFIYAKEGSHYQFISISVGRQVMACCEIRYLELPSRHKKDLAKGILGLYRNYLTLLEDSQTDTLTGLANRKTFERNIAHLLIRSSDAVLSVTENDQERRNRAVEENWLAIIDIDHFKQINDNFGHLYGDEILELLADLMRMTFRKNDRLFRFGGDEFVVLLRHVSYRSALSTLERLLKRVSSHSLPQVGQLTATVGFTKIRLGDTPNAVLGHADEALYHGKENGRNQVHSFETLVELGVLSKK